MLWETCGFVDNFMDLPKPVLPVLFTPGAGPTYTQIFEETMGAHGTKDDGYDAKAAELAGISAAFGAELASDPLGGSLGTAATLLTIVDPATLDSHLADYVATKEYGMGIVTAAAAQVEPQLLTLPLTPGRPDVSFLPPSQLAHDFGTVKLASAPVTYELGEELVYADGRDTGINPIGFVLNAPGIFSESETDHTYNNGDVRYRWYLTMSPATVGQWTAQYEYINQFNRQLVILTLTVTVIP
jgi:hypothetical protein